MADYYSRWKDYCERFAAELDVPFEFSDGLALQYVHAFGGSIPISAYAAFDCDPVADAQKLKAKHNG